MAYSDDTESNIIVPTKWYEKLPRLVWGDYEKVDQPDQWFEVYKLTETVYAIYEDGQFEEVISYLVLGNKKGVIIDTGNGIGNIKAVVERLTDLPVAVLNTHTHGDHIGGNYQFDEVYAFDTPFSRDREQNGQSRADMGNYIEGEMVWKPLPAYLDTDAWLIHPFKVTKWIKDGEVLDLGGRKLELIHTPGHTPDSLCILDRENKLFWTGDSFYPAPIYVYAPSTSLDQFIESFRKMTELLPEYEWVIPSHNEPKMKKELIKECYEAALSIREGTAGEYSEGVAEGINVHRYDYDRFSLIVKAARS